MTISLTQSTWAVGTGVPSGPPVQNCLIYLDQATANVYIYINNDWQLIFNLIGMGVQGNRGASWFIGVTPINEYTNPNAQTGDFYLYQTGMFVYQYTGSAWVSVGSILGTGVPGSPGSIGSTGQRGSWWFSQASPPDPDLITLFENDMWLNTSNNGVYKYVNSSTNPNVPSFNWAFMCTLGFVTINEIGTELTAKQHGTVVSTTVTAINMASGGTITQNGSIAGQIDITIPPSGTTLSVQNQGSLISSNVTTINVTGGGGSISNTTIPGSVNLNIPSETLSVLSSNSLVASSVTSINIINGTVTNDTINGRVDITIPTGGGGGGGVEISNVGINLGNAATVNSVGIEDGGQGTWTLEGQIATYKPNSTLDVNHGTFCVLVGGGSNTIETESYYSILVGGKNNNIGNTYYSVLVGGKNNTITNSYGIILGGQSNTSDEGIVIGGNYNTATTGGFVGRGIYNTAANNGVILAGGFNTINGNGFIGNGSHNYIPNNDSAPGGGFIGNGETNSTGNYSGFVGTGYDNKALGSYAAIINGKNNSANAQSGLVGAGSSNSVDGEFGVILNGNSNTVNYTYGVILNGINNTVSSNNGVILNGFNNLVSGQDGIILGGENNVSSLFAVVANGINNSANSIYAFIGNGFQNQISDLYGFIGNGGFNQITNYQYGVIVGGSQNRVNSTHGFIGNGRSNYISGSYGVVVGGISNSVKNSNGVIVGGTNNQVYGTAGAILGGNSNIAEAYGVSLGRYVNPKQRSGFMGFSSSMFEQPGDAQIGWTVMTAQTSSTNPTILTSTNTGEQNSPNPSNVVNILGGQSTMVDISLVAQQPNSSPSNWYTAAWKISGLFMATNPSGYGPPTIVGSPIITNIANNWPTMPSVSLGAEAIYGNGGIQLTVTPSNAGLTYWVAKVASVDVGVGLVNNT